MSAAGAAAAAAAAAAALSGVDVAAVAAAAAGGTAAGSGGGGGGGAAAAAAAAAEAAAGEDPLESGDVDVVALLNAEFPSESALSGLPEFTLRTQSQISALEDEISNAIRQQSKAGEQASQDIAESRVAIEALVGKVGEIKTQAAQSESMVNEICSDIKKLDTAKRHLQTTITSLKRLQMLVTAVQQLAVMAEAKEFEQVANLLDAVNQLMSTHFARYDHVPRIHALNETIQDVRDNLRREVSAVFREACDTIAKVAHTSVSEIDDGSGTNLMQAFADACLVLDALGPAVRNEQLQEFIDVQLASYNRTFAQGTDAGRLRRTEERFVWFKRVLREIDRKFGDAFPEHWRVQHRLCVSFLRKTQQMLERQLSSDTEEAENVQILCEALRATIRFEKEMAARFERPGDRAHAAGPGTAGAGANGMDDVADTDADGNPIVPGSAAAIRRKYEARAAAAAAATQEGRSGVVGRGFDVREDDAVAQATANQREELEEMHRPLPILGLATKMFDPFLGPYVLTERNNLENMLDNVMSNEDVDRDGALPVLTSSINMFVYMKTSIKRCLTLTNGQTFFNLQKEFKTCLSSYANRLRQQLPQRIVQMHHHHHHQGSGAGGASQLGTNVELYGMQRDQVEAVCYVINTGEYCADTIPPLENMIRSKIDEKYQQSVSMEPEQDTFQDLVAHAVKVLVGGLLYLMDPSLRAMQTKNWNAPSSDGDQSVYVRDIVSCVSDVVPGARDLMSTMYFRNFCGKFAATFLDCYRECLLRIRLRQPYDLAVQQLIVDFHDVKRVFTGLPNIGLATASSSAAAGGDRPKPIPISYSTLVTRYTSKIDTTLTLLQTEDAMLVERFKLMWPGGTSKDLRSIMAVKGLKRSDQEALLEEFGLSSAEPGGEQQPVAVGNVSSAAPVSPAPDSSDSTSGAGLAKRGMQSVANSMKQVFSR